MEIQDSRSVTDSARRGEELFQDDSIPSVGDLKPNPLVGAGCHGADLWPDGFNVLEATHNLSIATERDGENVKKLRRTGLAILGSGVRRPTFWAARTPLGPAAA